MKFSEMPYQRPDTDAVIREIQDLTARLKNAQSYEEARGVFLEYEEKSKAVDTTITHIRLPQQRFRVVRIHGAAVEHGHRPSRPGSVQLPQDRPDQGAHLLSLLRGGRTAGADGPDGLIGDDGAPKEFLRQAAQGGLHLHGYQFSLDPQLPLVQGLPHTEDGGHAFSMDGGQLPVHDGIRLPVVLPPFTVAHDDVFYPCIPQLGGGDFPGPGAFGLLAHILGAPGDMGAPEGPGS